MKGWRLFTLLPGWNARWISMLRSLISASSASIRSSFVFDEQSWGRYQGVTIIMNHSTAGITRGHEEQSFWLVLVPRHINFYCYLLLLVLEADDRVSSRDETATPTITLLRRLLATIALVCNGSLFIIFLLALALDRDICSRLDYLRHETAWQKCVLIKPGYICFKSDELSCW